MVRKQVQSRVCTPGFTMLQGSHIVTSYSCWFVMTRGYFIPRAYQSCRRWKASMLSFMVLVVVHSSQLYRKIHSANTLKWRIFCDNVRYLLLHTWLFSFMVLMVIIFRRCMSSLVSSRLPSSLHLRQESFPLTGVASGMVYSSVLCSFTCRLYAWSCPGTVTLVRLISSLDFDAYVISSAYLPSQWRNVAC